MKSCIEYNIFDDGFYNKNLNCMEERRKLGDISEKWKMSENPHQLCQGACVDEVMAMYTIQFIKY